LAWSDPENLFLLSLLLPFKEVGRSSCQSPKKSVNFKKKVPALFAYIAMSQGKMMEEQ